MTTPSPATPMYRTAPPSTPSQSTDVKDATEFASFQKTTNFEFGIVVGAVCVAFILIVLIIVVAVSAVLIRHCRSKNKKRAVIEAHSEETLQQQSNVLISSMSTDDIPHVNTSEEAPTSSTASSTPRRARSFQIMHPVARPTDPEHGVIAANSRTMPPSQYYNVLRNGYENVMSSKRNVAYGAWGRDHVMSARPVHGGEQEHI